jgi:hydrogenase maturation protease
LILVGGVGQLYQGDLDLGRRAAESLAQEGLGRQVLVEELHYGAVAVAQRLAEVSPSALVLVGATTRGRPPGSVERRRVKTPHRTEVDLVQRSVADAATGWVAMQLVVDVASGLGALPQRTVLVEVEPASTDPSEELSPSAERGLGMAREMVRAEVRRAPLLELADRLRPLCGRDGLEECAAVDTIRQLLAELEGLDDDGRWGATFRLRDTLRRRIAEGGTGYGMDHLDWSLWWALIEELDRLQPLEVSG